MIELLPGWDFLYKQTSISKLGQRLHRQIYLPIASNKTPIANWPVQIGESQVLGFGDWKGVAFNS